MKSWLMVISAILNGISSLVLVISLIGWIFSSVSSEVIAYSVLSLIISTIIFLSCAFLQDNEKNEVHQ